MTTENKKPQGDSAKREIKLVLILLVLVFIPVLASLYFTEERTVKAPVGADAFDSLSKEYEAHGIKAFLESRRRLKRQVSYNIKNDEDPRAQLAALNIAVYFFPDLLPENHLEKPFAEDSLRPLQVKIEESPGTSQAQYYFQELRTLVWNYENPANNTLGLSEHAEKMLHVYGSLSWK